MFAAQFQSAADVRLSFLVETQVTVAIADGQADGGFHFTLVDFDSVHFRGLTGPWQLRNLRQFHRPFRSGSSAADRLRFAAAYLASLEEPRIIGGCGFV